MWFIGLGAASTDHVGSLLTLPTRPLLLAACPTLRFLVSDIGQISPLRFAHNQTMQDGKLSPRVIEASRLKDGLLITFEDGKCAVYTAGLLYSMFPDADQVMQDLNDED